MELATRQAEQSIEQAKSTLEKEEGNINAMLGGMDGVGYVGPRPPTLSPVARSMEPREFTLAAFKILGASITSLPSDLYTCRGKRRT